MSPQIDQIKSVDENPEQSTPANQQEDIFTIQKYLLCLIFIQWVCTIDKEHIKHFFSSFLVRFSSDPSVRNLYDIYWR